MSARAARLLLTAIAATGPLSTTACLVLPLHDLPCRDDDECPTDGACDVDRGVCREDGARPLVKVRTLVLDDGTAVRDPFVPKDVESSLQIVLENEGDAVAENVRLELAELVCLHQSIGEGGRAAPAIQGLGVGDSVTVPWQITPINCSSPVIVDWFVFFSGRAERGTFNINIQRTQRAAP